jgi:3D (Asp-Asp-Asp) domain-containing protein
MFAARLFLLFVACFLAACSTRKLPKYEKPMARARFQTVRTTAYTHTEADHLAYGNKSALGTPLKSGPDLHSAAADWARWPAGTIFRICSTGKTYFVDDYGWALAGRNTIDLYKPSRAAMNDWGVRHEKIEILHWGDPWACYRRMKPVENHKHIARMMKEIKEFYTKPSSRPVQEIPPTSIALAIPVSPR